MDEPTTPRMAAELTVDELTLRRLGPDDLAELHEIFSDPAVHVVGDGPVSSLDETRAWLENRALRRQEHGVDWYGVRVPSGELVGNVGIFLGRTSPHPEVGFEIRSEHQGRRIGRRAARAVAAEAYRAGFEQVWATVRTWNVPSLRCLAHAGFVAERTEFDARGELVYLRHVSG